MSALSRIRLELGRTRDFPQGSEAHGYEFIAPLKVDGHVDAGVWRREKEHCGVRRFWGSERDEHGMLRHVGKGWLFDYGNGDEADGPFFRLDAHAFIAGNYVSIRERDGITRPFRVVAVAPLFVAGATR
jgi:hypothetical protein